MKNFTFKVTATLLMTCMSLTSAAGKEGGAYDVLVSSLDDSVVLADPFAINNEGEPTHFDILFSDEIKAEMKRIEQIIQSVHWFEYIQNPAKRSYYDNDYVKSGSKLNKIVEDLVRSPQNKYHLVSKLPDHDECKQPVSYPWQPEGTRVVRGACTIGDETWILSDLFVKMKLRDQGVALLHEGLRRIEPMVHDISIFRISRGLLVALDHMNRQTNRQNPRVALNSTDAGAYLAAITSLYSLNHYGILNSDDPGNRKLLRNITIYRNGGATIGGSNSKIHPTAFAGIGTHLYVTAALGENAVALNSSISGELRANALVANSKLSANAVVGESSQVLDSQIKDGVQIQAGAQVNNSVLDEKTFVGENSKIRDATLEKNSQIGRNIQANGLVITGSMARIDDNGVFENVIMTSSTPIVIERGVKLVKTALVSEEIFVAEGAQTSNVIIQNSKGHGDKRRFKIYLGRDSRTEHVTMENETGAYHSVSVSVENGATLKNFRKASFEDKPNSEYPWILVPAGKSVDLQDRFYCPNGTNRFLLRDKLERYSLTDIQSFVKYCVK